MIDARDAASKEWSSHLLSVTFNPPRGMSEEAQTEWARDLQEAVRRTLPKAERSDLLELLDTARKNLRARARTIAWPTVNEVVAAIREAIDGGKERALTDGGTGWPHRNSEYVIDSTIKWIRLFKGWPQYLEHPREVAQEIVVRTDYQLADLIRMGLRVTKAEAEVAGVLYGREQPAESVQRMPSSHGDFR